MLNLVLARSILQLSTVTRICFRLLLVIYNLLLLLLQKFIQNLLLYYNLLVY